MNMTVVDRERDELISLFLGKMASIDKIGDKIGSTLSITCTQLDLTQPPPLEWQ